MDQKGKAHPTILLVEDTVDTRYVLGLTLLEQGYRVLTATNGQEALDTALRERPDLILMDLNLPRMDGLMATALIRSHEELRRVPILAITAYDTYGMREAALEAGCNGYMIKPLDFDRLETILRDYCG